MGDMGEMFNHMKEVSKDRRRSNRESSAAMLKEQGVEFVEKNDGAHLIVRGRDGLIDFWPGTGKFICRNGKSGRGVRNVLKLCVTEEAKK